MCNTGWSIVSRVITILSLSVCAIHEIMVNTYFNNTLLTRGGTSETIKKIIYNKSKSIPFEGESSPTIKLLMIWNTDRYVQVVVGGARV